MSTELSTQFKKKRSFKIWLFLSGAVLFFPSFSSAFGTLYYATSTPNQKLVDVLSGSLERNLAFYPIFIDQTLKADSVKLYFRDVNTQQSICPKVDDVLGATTTSPYTQFFFIKLLPASTTYSDVMDYIVKKGYYTAPYVTSSSGGVKSHQPFYVGYQDSQVPFSFSPDDDGGCVFSLYDYSGGSQVYTGTVESGWYVLRFLRNAKATSLNYDYDVDVNGSGATSTTAIRIVGEKSFKTASAYINLDGGVPARTTLYPINLVPSFPAMLFPSITIAQDTVECSLSDVLSCLSQVIRWLFIPKSADFSSQMVVFKDGFLAKAPWGYATRFYSLLVDSGYATSTPPSIAVTFPSGQGLPSDLVGLSVAFSPWTAFSSTSPLMTATGLGMGNFMDVFMPWWNIIMGFFFVFLIFKMIFGFVLGHKKDSLADDPKATYATGQGEYYRGGRWGGMK